MYRALIQLMTFQFTIIQILFKSKNDLVLETIELRQQLAIYQAKNEDHKSITDLTRSFLVSLKRAWPKGSDKNGVAERYVLSVRNDMLNQMIIFNEEHLRDFMKQYFEYYNNERCHLAIGRDSPNGRKIQNKPFKSAKIISSPRIGGLHHVYKWDKAA